MNSDRRAKASSVFDGMFENLKSFSSLCGEPQVFNRVRRVFCCLDIVLRVKAICGSCWFVFLRRMKAFACLSLLFWLVVLVSALARSFFSVPPFYEEVGFRASFLVFGDNWIFVVLGIFFFNLVLSAFVVVTLPGLVLFPLSVFFLLFRAAVWGELLAFASAMRFVVALPVLMLEGGAYVLAALAGSLLGLGWLMPEHQVYAGAGFSRRYAVGKAFREALNLYLLVTLLLLAAAVAEAIILSLPPKAF